MVKKIDLTKTSLLSKFKKLGRLTPAGIILDVLIDFFDAEPLGDLTVPDWALKTESEEPIESPSLPAPLPPINRVKPPPQRIYVENPFADINPTNNTPVAPTIPPRTYNKPVNNSSNTEYEYTVEIEQGISDRTYGCLLVRPYYSEPIPWCNHQVEQNFWQTLLDGMSNYVDEIISELIEDNIKNAAKFAFLLLPLPSFLKPITIFGIDAIISLSEYYSDRNKIIDNYPLTGKISTGGVQIIDCNLEKTDFSLQPFELSLNMEYNECGIPLNLYDITTRAKGNQLLILYKNNDLPQPRRQMTIPFCKDVSGYSNEQMLSALPNQLDTGHVIQEIYLVGKSQEINSQSSIKILTKNESLESQESFVNRTIRPLVAEFCTDDAVISNFTAHSPKSVQKLAKGIYQIYKVQYIGVNKVNSNWQVLKQWKFD